MKTRGWCAAAAVAAMVSVPVATSAEEIVYLPSWQGNVSQIQWGIVDYVMYAFAIPNGDGSVGAIENGAKLSQACQAAHSNGKRCLLSFGGWNNGNDSGFEAIAASSSARSNFANTCLSLINQYGLDGVDFDWEYPEAEDAANYGLMIDAVRARIGSSKLITAAAANHGYNARAVQQNLGKLNFAMIMSYDGDGGAGHSPYGYAVTAMDDWAPYGLGKTFLGVPFYARPSWAGYATLLAAGCSASSDTCMYQGTTNYYNGQPTIRSKRALCQQRGCRGLMAWEVTFDVSDSRSLQQAMNGGGGVAPTPTPAPTSTPGPGPTATPQPTATPGGGSSTNVEAESGTVAGATRVSSCSACSGGSKVGYVGNGSANYVTLNVSASTSGSRTMNIYYLVSGTRSLSYSVNGGGAGTVSLTGSSFSTVAPPRAVTISLNAGNNTVRFFNNSAYGPDLDRITIGGGGGATPTPTPAPTATPGGPRPTPTPTPAPGGTWQPNTFYSVGAQVTYGGASYRCQQAHTSLVGWEPPNAPALWLRL